MGILSCLTSGWWGSVFDHSGRRIVLLISTFGFLANAVVHVITAWFVYILPGVYWFPLIGYLIQGLCGSVPTRSAGILAYIRNIHNQLSLALRVVLSCPHETIFTQITIFYTSTFMFAGAAAGPFFSGLLIRAAGGILPAFYLVTILDSLYIIYLLCIPESLTPVSVRDARPRPSHEDASETSDGCVLVLGILKSATRFLVPLTVLLSQSSLDADPLKRNRNRKDWSLLFVIIAYGLVMSVAGSMPYKYQYPAARFNWTASAEDTSYFASIVSATRAIFLAVILPFIIKYFKPSPIWLPSMPNEPLQGFTDCSPSHDAGLSLSSAQPISSDQRSIVSHSAAFDLTLARSCVGLEVLTFLGMAVASTGTIFTLASANSSLSCGFHSAAQALALHIYTNRHSPNRGKVEALLSALCVIHALGSQIISPALYGFVYLTTVMVLPQAIMIVSACTIFLAFVLVSFARVPSKLVGDRLAFEHTNDGNEAEVGIEVMRIYLS